MLTYAACAEAAESTAVMGVSALVANRCEVTAEGATARLSCSHPADVTVLRSGADPVQVPVDGARPQLIPLTETDGAPILVIAY